jgi:hypothetical protein
VEQENSAIERNDGVFTWFVAVFNPNGEQNPMGGGKFRADRGYRGGKYWHRPDRIAHTLIVYHKNS